jgi:hypothetical protein
MPRRIKSNSFALDATLAIGRMSAIGSIAASHQFNSPAAAFGQKQSLAVRFHVFRSFAAVDGELLINELLKS